MANSTVDTGRNTLRPVPNPTGAVAEIPGPRVSPEPAPRVSDVDMRPTFGAEKLPNAGDQGGVAPLPGGIPGGSPRPSGQQEGQGTSTTAGGQGRDLGGPGRAS